VALVNLTAILLLSRWVFGCLADYESTLRADVVPRFRATDNEHLSKPLTSDVW